MIDNALMELSHLDTMLAQATRIDEITEVRARAEAMRTYAVNIKASREQCQEYTVARIRAERKAGQVLSTLGLHGNNQHKRKSNDSMSSLKDCNITPSESHRWQTIAKLPDDLFENIMKERYDSKDDITTAYFYNAAKIHIGNTRTSAYQTKPQAVDVELAKHMYMSAAHHYAGIEWWECENWERKEIDTEITDAIEAWKAKKGNGNE